MGSRWSSSFRPTARRISVVALSLLALAIVAPGSAVAGGVRNLQVLDRCDPASFNAMFGDGVCTLRTSGVPVEQFLRRVNPEGFAHHPRRFSPGRLTLKRGQVLQLDNGGAEPHTFAEVVDFAGATTPPLNAVFPPGTP